MDVLTFIAEIVESIAWPVAVISALLVLKKDLPKIIGSLKRIKYKDVTLEFEEMALAVEQKTKNLPAPEAVDAPAAKSREALREELHGMVSSAPRQAIIQAWLQLEASAIDAIRRSGVATVYTSMPGPMRLRDYLKKGGLLTGIDVALFESLRELRNAAVHNPDAQFTDQSVRNFIDAALRLAAHFEYAAQTL